MIATQSELTALFDDQAEAILTKDVDRLNVSVFPRHPLL